MNDEDVFVRENFNKFNFPYENHGSFTVNVEDYLAGLWQECLEQVYGEPCIRINARGTECDRLWTISSDRKDTAQKSQFIFTTITNQKTRNKANY